MKTIILTVSFLCIGLFVVNAQETQFGVVANLVTANAKIKVEGNSSSDGAIGFSAGVFADIAINEKFYFRPEVLFTSVKDSDAEEGVQFIQVPLFLKYYVIEKFYIQGGPQVTYTLEDIDQDNFTKFNIGVGLGVGYDFTENFFIQSRSTYQLNNYFTGDADITSRINFFNIGVGYTF